MRLQQLEQLLLFSASCSCPIVIYVTGVTLDETSVSLDAGATKTLTATDKNDTFQFQSNHHI